MNTILSEKSQKFYNIITEKFGDILRVTKPYGGKVKSGDRTKRSLSYVGTMDSTDVNHQLFCELSEFLQWETKFGLKISRYGRATNRRERFLSQSSVPAKFGDYFDVYISERDNYDHDIVERYRRKLVVPMDSSLEKYQSHMRGRRDRENGNSSVVSQVETNSTVTLTDDEKTILSKASIILERISN